MHHALPSKGTPSNARAGGRARPANLLFAVLENIGNIFNLTRRRSIRPGIEPHPDMRACFRDSTEASQL